MQNGWTFHGPCDLFNLPSWPPITIKLGAYRGLTVKAKFISESTDGRPFVLGLGTSDKDITGKITTFFPLYGTNGGCTDFYLNPTKCRGKGFVYELLMNPPSSTVPMGIQHSPAFRIRNTGSYPGRKCQQATLVASGGKWRWSEFPQVVSPKNGVLAFASVQWGLTLQPGSFEVEAFHCF